MKTRLLQQPSVDTLPTAEARSPEAIPPGVDRRQEHNAVSFEGISFETGPEPASQEPPSVAPTPPRQPQQVSQRPKGRLVVAGVLAVFVLYVASSLYASFFRFDAHGIVTGREIKVSAPWAGTLDAVYVHVGDTVRQGDILAVVEDTELRHSVQRLGDELLAAQAELDAQVATLSIGALRRRESNRDTRARYYELKGDLLLQQSRYEEIKSRRTRYEQLLTRQAVSDEELESLAFQEEGLRARVEHLQQAVDTLNARIDDTVEPSYDEQQLKPWLAKIEHLKADLVRQREVQDQSLIRAPANGTILAVWQHVGEQIDLQTPLVEVLQEDTTELVLYMTQRRSRAYSVGDWVKVRVAPAGKAMRCQVVRIGQRFEQPPAHVSSHYTKDSPLLPIYVAPPAKLPKGTTLPLGGEVQASPCWFGA